MKPKKQRAIEISIEQSLLARGSEEVKREFLADQQNGTVRKSTYLQIRLKLMLQWNRPPIV